MNIFNIFKLRFFFLLSFNAQSRFISQCTNLSRQIRELYVFRFAGEHASLWPALNSRVGALRCAPFSVQTETETEAWKAGSRLSSWQRSRQRENAEIKMIPFAVYGKYILADTFVADTDTDTNGTRNSKCN